MLVFVIVQAIGDGKPDISEQVVDPTYTIYFMKLFQVELFTN